MTFIVEDISWDGAWVFLSDDNLGRLQIEQKDSTNIAFRVGGSVINSVNGSSYANSIEGYGTIDGSTITFTSEIPEDCGGTMRQADSIITVQFNNDMSIHLKFI